MPITATPTVGAPTTCCQPPALTTPVLTPFPWEGQNVLAAPTATVHGRPLLAKMQTYRITGGQAAVLERQLIDRQGNPIDLTGLEGGSASAPVAPYAERYTLKFRLREYLALGQATAASAEFPVEIVDATQGLVRVSLPATATRRAGVYFGEIAVCGPELDGVAPVLFSNSFYVLVEMGLWADQRLKGPPTIMEVRLHLRDTDPEESFLLDNIAFQDTEIALSDCPAGAVLERGPAADPDLYDANVPFPLPLAQKGSAASCFDRRRAAPSQQPSVLRGRGGDQRLRQRTKL